MAQSSIGTDTETSNIMKFLRVRSQVETKLFMSEFGKALKIVLDSLEGTQKVFYQIESDMASHSLTIRFGSVLGYGDLPSEIQKQIQEHEKVQRAIEDGDSKAIITRTFEVDPKHLEFLKKQKGEKA